MMTEQCLDLPTGMSVRSGVRPGRGGLGVIRSVRLGQSPTPTKRTAGSLKRFMSGNPERFVAGNTQPNGE